MHPPSNTSHTYSLTHSQKYDAAAAKAYYDAHPLEYLGRLAFIASSASSFGAALALDYLTGIFLALT